MNQIHTDEGGVGVGLPERPAPRGVPEVHRSRSGRRGPSAVHLAGMGAGVTITGWFLPRGALVQGCRNFRRITGVRSRGHACGRLSGWAGRCLKFGSRPSRSLRRSAARSLGWRFLPSGLRREGRNRAAGTSRRRPDYERPQQIRCSNSKPPAVARLVDSQMRKRRRSPVTRVVSTTATRRRRIRNFGAVTSSRTKVRHRHRCGENQTLSRKGKLK